MPPIQTTGIIKNQEDNGSVNENDNTSTESVAYKSCNENRYVKENDDINISAIMHEPMDDD